MLYAMNKLRLSTYEADILITFTRLLLDFFDTALLKYSHIFYIMFRFCLALSKKIQTINQNDHKVLKSVIFQGGRL